MKADNGTSKIYAQENDLCNLCLCIFIHNDNDSNTDLI